MSFEYVRNDGNRRIVVVSRDALTLALGVLDRQAAEGTWAYSLMYDELAASATTLTSADMRALAYRAGILVQDHGVRGPVAVVTLAPSTFGMIRMYSTLTEPLASPFRCFTIARAPRYGSPPPRPRLDRI